MYGVVVIINKRLSYRRQATCQRYTTMKVTENDNIW